MIHALATWLGFVTGLAFVGPEQADLTRIVTALGMLICYGVACRFFAAQGGRDPKRWMIGGFTLGVLAVAVLLALGDRDSPAQS